MFNQEQLAAIAAAMSILQQSIQTNGTANTSSPSSSSASATTTSNNSNNNPLAVAQQQLAAAAAAAAAAGTQQSTPPPPIQQQQHHASSQSRQHPSQQQQQQQQLMTQAFTQRLQQQLQHIVQQSHRQPQQQSPQQQPHPSRSMMGDQTGPISMRQQQSLQNHSLQQSHLLAGDLQKRKRGRPPMTAPAVTKAGSSAGPSTTQQFNYLDLIIKNQQERDRMQRDNRLQREREQQLRKQQELKKLEEFKLNQERERHREMQLQQERERQQRLEMERQRKAQHRMAMADIDRERRRQHMIMVRNMDAYKRNEEREKAITAMMDERNKQNERRLHQKRLEAELIKELRKPVDDMMLKNQKPLATLNRIPGLKLPGKAFADLLMSYEFLFNFGDTVGLELRQIPSINTLQLGLLNHEDKAEDQLIAIMHHLCMFAIKDPRFPYTGSTKEIENLPRTNEGLSQLLHFYLQVLTLNAKTEMEHESRLYRLIEQKYFLALNATQKAEMLAFICNELLCSQTVTKQMEDTIENVAKLRKDKWVLENELRKFRSVKTKREAKEEAELRAREAAEAAAQVAAAAAEAAAEASKLNGETEAKEEGNNNDSIEDVKSNIKKEDQDKTKESLTNGSTAAENHPPVKKDTDTIAQQNTTNDLDDLEPEMTNDELYRKIENLTRQYNKTSNKLERAINSMRANPLGQDRYRRRYWVLPQVGGVFVEGMESSEPEEIVNNHFTDEELEEYEKEQQALLEQAKEAESKVEPSEETADKTDVEEEKDDDDMDIKEEADEKDEDEPMETNDEENAESTDVKVEAKSESNENGEAENNGTAVEARDSEEPTQEAASKIPWFSILPRPTCQFIASADNNTNEDEDSQKRVGEQDAEEEKTELTLEELKDKRHEICPGLAKRLEELEAEQYETPRKIHPQFQYGWWRITDSQQLKAMLTVLHERGSRERTLLKHLTKHFQYACNSCRNSTVDFEITTYDRQLASKNYGAPIPHTDDDSADDIRDGEEDDEDEGDDYEEDIGDDKVNLQQAAAAPAKKSKRKKGTRSARSRRLRARAAARKKVENSRNKVAQRIN